MGVYRNKPRALINVYYLGTRLVLLTDRVNLVEEVFRVSGILVTTAYSIPHETGYLTILSTLSYWPSFLYLILLHIDYHNVNTFFLNTTNITVWLRNFHEICY